MLLALWEYFIHSFGLYVAWVQAGGEMLDREAVKQTVTAKLANYLEDK